VDSFFFGINTQKLSKIGAIDNNGVPLSHVDHDTKLSSEEHLFSRLRSSSFLRSVIFNKGQTLIRQGEMFEDAHVIFQGKVRVTVGDSFFYMGPGAVIGLSEGIAGVPSRWTIQAETLLNTRTISIKKTIDEIRVTDSGLRSICRVTVMRTLDIHDVPESLK
jgi:CRP-like cAMP-binding protein